LLVTETTSLFLKTPPFYSLTDRPVKRVLSVAAATVGTTTDYG
jgi:hypothetical protein